MKRTLHIVIVTYNNRELLDRCVASVLNSIDGSGLEGKITIVDNASTDGTKEMVTGKYPSLNYILNERNVGLAKALNIGIREGTSSDFTLLLNDDVELFPDTIKSLMRTLDSYPDAMAMPACLIYPDGTLQRVKVRILGVNERIKEGVQYIRFAGTTACLYRTGIFHRLGLFDEFYFFYNEDLDFSLRAKRHGMKFIFNPGVKVIHHRKKGRAKAMQTIRPYYYATDYYFYRKNYGILFSSVYLLMALVHIAFWKRRYAKEKDSEKLLLLKKGQQKLRETVRQFKKLRGESLAV